MRERNRSENICKYQYNDIYLFDAKYTFFHRMSLHCCLWFFFVLLLLLSFREPPNRITVTHENGSPVYKWAAYRTHRQMIAVNLIMNKCFLTNSFHLFEILCYVLQFLELSQQGREKQKIEIWRTTNKTKIVEEIRRNELKIHIAQYLIQNCKSKRTRTNDFIVWSRFFCLFVCSFACLCVFSVRNLFLPESSKRMELSITQWEKDFAIIVHKHSRYCY